MLSRKVKRLVDASLQVLLVASRLGHVNRTLAALEVVDGMVGQPGLRVEQAARFSDCSGEWINFLFMQSH